MLCKWTFKYCTWIFKGCIWDSKHITWTSDHENELSNDVFEISDTPPELQIMEMNFQILHLNLQTMYLRFQAHHLTFRLWRWMFKWCIWNFRYTTWTFKWDFWDFRCSTWTSDHENKSSNVASELWDAAFEISDTTYPKIPPPPKPPQIPPKKPPKNPPKNPPNTPPNTPLATPMPLITPPHTPWWVLVLQVLHLKWNVFGPGCHMFLVRKTSFMLYFNVNGVSWECIAQRRNACAKSSEIWLVYRGWWDNAGILTAERFDKWLWSSEPKLQLEELSSSWKHPVQGPKEWRNRLATWGRCRGRRTRPIREKEQGDIDFWRR